MTTDRAQAAAEDLVDEQGLADVLVAHTADGLMATDLDGVIVWANPRAHAFYRVSSGALVGRRVSVPAVGMRTAVPLPDSESARLVEMVARPVRWQGRELMVVGLRDVTGRVQVAREMQASLAERERLLAVADQMRLAQLSVMEDQQLAQDALRESERFLRGSLDGLAAHVAILDESGRILLTNRAWKEFGESNGLRASDESEGTNYLLVCDRAAAAGCEDARAFAEGAREVLGGERTQYTLEYACETRDGMLRFVVRVTRFPGDGPPRVVVAHENITERILAEEALRESEQHFRNLADAASALIWTSDASGACDYFNQPWLTYTGRSLWQEQGDGWTEGVHPEDVSRCIGIYRAALAHCEPLSLDYRLRRHDGVYRWFQDDAHPRYDSQGVFLGYVGYLLDVTDRRAAEERIDRLNSVLRAVRDVNELMVRVVEVDPLIDGATRLLAADRGHAWASIILVDAEGRPERWVQAGERDLPRELVTLLSEGHLPPCCQLASNAPEGVAVTVGDAVCTTCPVPGATRDSDRFWIPIRHEERLYGYLGIAGRPGLQVDSEERGLMAELAGDLGYALHNMDVARSRAAAEQERHSLELQLNQAQRMEAIGRLAGGVAHDFNNMLSVILASVEMARETISCDHPLYAELGEIERAGRRSADLTRQLLAFARKQSIAPQVVDLNEALEGMLNMLRRLIGEDIDLVWLPQTGIWPVIMDPSQLDQILANLCINARDAIQGGGRITIETVNGALDEAYSSTHVAAVPGEYVVLVVSDTGTGIEPEIQAHLFEPFFSTKDPGQGTGLGLATVYGIVTQNKGFIEVHTRLGEGTTFTIYLPRHHAEHQTETLPQTPATPAGRGETILLVEDEMSILRVGRRMLQLLGYVVLTAASPDEALRMAETGMPRPDLLITDVVMPGMDGGALAQGMQVHFPGLKTLFMSGYTAEMIAHQGVLDEGVRFIGKPFTLYTLGTTVREMLCPEP